MKNFINKIKFNIASLKCNHEIYKLIEYQEYYETKIIIYCPKCSRRKVTSSIDYNAYIIQKKVDENYKNDNVKTDLIKSSDKK